MDAVDLRAFVFYTFNQRAMQKSFILHLDSLGVLNKMTDEQAGKLIKLIFQYKTTGTLPDDLDFGMSMAIDPFVNQFKRDEEKYLSTVERNRANGSKGGRPKGTETETQTNPKNPSGFSEIQEKPIEPKKPYSDSDTDSVIDNDTDSVSVTESETLFLLEKETKVEPVIFYPYNSEDFLINWGAWKKNKKEVHKFKWNDVNEQAALNKLGKLAKSEKEAIEIIQESLAQGWKGFFELKNKTNGTEQKSPAEQFADIYNSDAAKNFRFSP